MRAATGFMQYRAGELAADRIIHLMGSLAGVVGSAILQIPAMSLGHSEIMSLAVPT